MKRRTVSPDVTQRRFVDAGKTVYDCIAAGVLVECPVCGGCAEHRPISADESHHGMFAPRRLVCTHCGLTRHWAEHGLYGRSWRESPIRDEYFGAVLWLRGSFGDAEVWAYNWDHLAYIEKYVAAGHRTRKRDPKTGWSNRSLVSRLPRSITAARNRLQVLAAIKKIRQTRGSQQTR